MAPGDTKKLGIIVKPADWKVDYVSSDESVATVSSDGTITAKKAGTAIITATGRGSAARVVCNVTVVASSYGIASAEAKHTNVVRVTFTTPISENDREKLNVALTYGGTAQKFTKTWAKDGSYVDLTKEGDYSAGTNYVATISGDNISIDAKTSTITFGIVDAFPANIIIASGQAFPKANRISLKYQVVDQYGDDYKTVKPSDITWYLSSTNNRLSLGTKSIVSGFDTYGTAVLDMSGAFTNLSSESDYNLTITVRGTITNKSAVSSCNDITIRPVQLVSAEIVSINANASGDSQAIYQKDDEQSIDIKVNAYEEGANGAKGALWDPDVYQTFVRTNTNVNPNVDIYENSYANNIDIHATDIAGTIGKTLEIAPKYVDKKFSGIWTVKIPASAYGKFSLSIAANAKATPVVTTYEVLKKAEAAKVVFPADSFSGKLGETVVKIPVKFQDQYEKDITTTVTSFDDLSVSSDDLTTASLKTVSGSCKYENGNVIVDLSAGVFKDGVSGGSLTITAGSDKAKTFGKTSLITSKKVELTAARTATTLTVKSDNTKGSNGEYKLALIGDQKETIKIAVADQYGDAFEYNGKFAVLSGLSTTGAACKVVAYGVGPSGDTQSGVKQTLNNADLANKQGSYVALDIIGSAVTSSKTENLSIQLYSAYTDANTNTKVGSPIKLTVTTNVAPSKFAIIPDSTAVSNGVQAGTPVGLTIQAQDSQGNPISTYDAKHEMEIVGSNGDTYKFEGSEAVQFTNGSSVALQMPTKVAADSVTYSTTFTMANGTTVNPVSTTGIKVKANAIKYVYGACDSTPTRFIELHFQDAKGGNNVANTAAKLTISDVVIKDNNDVEITSDNILLGASGTTKTIFYKVGDVVHQYVVLKKNVDTAYKYSFKVEGCPETFSFTGAQIKANTTANSAEYVAPVYNFTVSPTLSTVTIKNTAGQKSKITATLKDQDGAPIAATNVTFTATSTDHGTISNITTDSTGTATLTTVDGTCYGTFDAKVGTVKIGSITVAKSVATTVGAANKTATGTYTMQVIDQYGVDFASNTGYTVTANLATDTAVNIISKDSTITATAATASVTGCTADASGVVTVYVSNSSAPTTLVDANASTHITGTVVASAS